MPSKLKECARLAARVAALCALAAVPAFAQSPSAPPVGPAQTDPTRPPGTERPQDVTPRARPAANEPATRPATQTTPATTATTNAATATAPAVAPAPDAKSDANSDTATPRPLPPMPSLSRVGVDAGQTRPLSLNEAIRVALENNNDIGIARVEVRQAEALLEGFRGAYDPVFQIAPQIYNSVAPQSTSLGGSDETGTTSTTDLSWNQSLVRRLSAGGGQYEVFFNNNKRATTSSFNLLNPVYSASLGVSYTQPLWRDRSIDRTRRDIRIQAKRVAQSDADFRQRVTDVISQVQRAYWDLVFALRDEQNQIANLNLARENFRRTESAVAAGSAAPLERAEVQTELSSREAAVLVAAQNVSVAENNLKALILGDPLSPDWSAALLPTDEPSFAESPVSLSEALAEARTNRPELQRLRIQQEINSVEVSYLKNQTKPRVDVQATVSSTGLSGTPVEGAGAVPGDMSGGYFKTLGNVGTFRTRNVAVGVTIQLPLKNRAAQSALAYARLEEEKLSMTTRARAQSVEIEVRNAAQAAETARRRVLAARTAREHAEHQFAGERRLYELGRSTTFLLFQRQNQLVETRNQELRAATDFNKALAELQRATSTTLQANSIILETPGGR